YGQLAWALRSDPRVVVMDRVNVRHLAPDDVPGPPPDLVVADLSFISLTLVLSALRAAAAAEADHLLLVKPQFEAGPDLVGKGGVVRDPQVWEQAMAAVAHEGANVGLGLTAAVPSRLPGPAGNVEFFLHLRADGERDIASTVRDAAASGRGLAGR
ncbi:MAG TPA: SAM-dependent methyltransferase, partial [Egibacteraceae bacterium]|nr:SAM-dependent methyltransferase [Egibacteraceae bacterium]